MFNCNAPKSGIAHSCRRLVQQHLWEERLPDPATPSGAGTAQGHDLRATGHCPITGLVACGEQRRRDQATPFGAATVPGRDLHGNAATPGWSLVKNGIGKIRPPPVVLLHCQVLLAGRSRRILPDSDTRYGPRSRSPGAGLDPDHAVLARPRQESIPGHCVLGAACRTPRWCPGRRGLVVQQRVPAVVPRVGGRLEASGRMEDPEARRREIHGRKKNYTKRRVQSLPRGPGN